MYNITPKIVETLLSIEDLREDFHEVATRSLVNLQSNIGDLNMFLLATRGKKITDKRREATTQYLANILFYIALLIHLNDIPPDLFDMEDGVTGGVSELVSMLDEELFNSPLMLGNRMMSVASELGDYMWSEKFEADEVEEEKTEDEPVLGSKLEIPEDGSGYHSFMENLMEGVRAEAESESEMEDPDYGDFHFASDPDNLAEAMIAELLACVMVMADLCDIDLGVCMFNASTQQEI